MSTTDAQSLRPRGRPETALVPGTSRKYARQWWWSQHNRDEYVCPDCGRGNDRVIEFHIHHIDGDPLNNNPENLIGLCNRCHSWRHNTGPTLSGLDVEEWKQAFVGKSGAENPISHIRFMNGDQS